MSTIFFLLFFFCVCNRTTSQERSAMKVKVNSYWRAIKQNYNVDMHYFTFLRNRATSQDQRNARKKMHLSPSPQREVKKKIINGNWKISVLKPPL